MIKCIKILVLFSGTLLLLSCKDEKIRESVDKNGSIEISVKTEAFGDKTIYTFTENIYFENKLLKSSVRMDTLPSLGETVQEFENEERTWTEKVQKQYKFFVTVK